MVELLFYASFYSFTPKINDLHQPMFNCVHNLVLFSDFLKIVKIFKVKFVGLLIMVGVVQGYSSQD